MDDEKCKLQKIKKIEETIEIFFPLCFNLDDFYNEEEKLGDATSDQYEVGPPIVIDQLHIENEIWDEEPNGVYLNEPSEELPCLDELRVDYVLNRP